MMLAVSVVVIVVVGGGDDGGAVDVASFGCGLI